MSKFLNISTDNTLGGNNSSNEVVSSQKAVKDYVDSHGGGSYTAGTGIDITNDVISVASPTLTNSSTFSSSVGIFSDFGQYGYSSVGMGYSSVADSSGDVAIGYMSQARNSYATALGYYAQASGYCSIQLGYGSNNTRDKFNVGFFRGTDNQSHNWELLDGTTGLIPDDRISSNIARTSAIPSVDQTYDGTSTNAQSGVAVAQALSSVSVSKDNLSITNNSNNQLQTVGVIDQNDTTQAIKTWTGTLAQYNAIATKDPDTLYNITDDVSGGTSVYTKAEVDSAISSAISTLVGGIYPVGSIYIGTGNTCPIASLISGSIWTLVSSGRVLQGADGGHSAGSTIEAGLPNITGSFSNWAGVNQCDLGEVAGNTTGCVQNVMASCDKQLSLAARTASAGTGLVSIDASQSNSIYGNSSTVQPPAYVVNIFERTA